MKQIYTYLLCIVCLCPTFSQSNISGVINTYTSVSALSNSGCSTCSNPLCYTEITVGSSTGFSVGGVALIMQMQGATIDRTNTSSFGNITYYNNTGNFEFANIIAIPNATTIRVSVLTLTYSLPTSATPGVVQLISTPMYGGDVNITGDLTATAWNGLAGGVVAFIATGKVVMNADIDVKGKGFRGYPHNELSNGDCAEDDYFLSLATQSKQGALKAEGVALVETNMELGRGKQSNGGGGGDGHNGGGGGGGNGGTGGYGGQMYEGCVNIWGRGEGGVALTGTSSTRIFMGGGGGTGDSNATGLADPGGDGMNGGGIVLVIADSIVNNTSTSGFTGVGGPIYPASNQYYKAPSADDAMEFDVFCQLTLNSITVDAQAAQTVRVSVLSHDRANVLYGPVAVAVPAGVSAVPLNLSIAPGHSYMLSLSGSTGSLAFGNGNTGVYPYTIPDVISILGTEGNAPGKNIAYAFNWNVSAQCASGGYKIDASGLDNPFGVTADGGGGGGAGGSIFLRSNGYRGAINMLATGGKGAHMLGGGCHAPGGGGGGGYICMNTMTPPLLVNRNIAGARPGLIPYSQVTCLTPATGYNSHAATPGAVGKLCTGLLQLPPCTLPLYFTAFQGYNSLGFNYLSWSVAAGEASSIFILEKSLNGIHFVPIATVNHNADNYYRYEDASDKKCYYRVKSVDVSGGNAYTKVISLNSVELDYEIYPNPNQGSFVVKVNSAAVLTSLQIIDMKGRLVQHLVNDDDLDTFQVSSLNRGVYILKINIDNEVVMRKIIVCD